MERLRSLRKMITEKGFYQNVYNLDEAQERCIALYQLHPAGHQVRAWWGGGSREETQLGQKPCSLCFAPLQKGRAPSSPGVPRGHGFLYLLKVLAVLVVALQGEHLKAWNVSGHPLKFYESSLKTNKRWHYFIQWVVNIWNSLSSRCCVVHKYK